MKKLNFLAVAAMLFAAITLTGCEPTETPDDGNGTETPGNNDEDGGGNNGDIRLVDKITFDDDFGYTFFYDAQNRIVKMEAFDDWTYEEDEYDTITYSYGANTLTENESWNIYTVESGEEPYWQRAILNNVYGLDSQGRVTSKLSHSWKYWENEELDDDESYKPDLVWSYENGYLKTYTNPHSGDGGGSEGEYTTSSAIEYFWENGNLIKTVQTYTYRYVGGTHEDEVRSTSETTYTYSDKIYSANVSFDLSAHSLWLLDSDMDHTECFRGIEGKLPKNLLSSSTTTSDSGFTYVYEYEWELDSEGYITKMTETHDYGSGQINTSIITVTYKN